MSDQLPGRAARLDRALADLLAQAPELEAAAIVSFDGLAMASALPLGMNEDRVAAMSGKRVQFEYLEKNREGDHICYISNLAKIRSHYPGWNITRSLDDIFSQIYTSVSNRKQG